MKKLLFFALMLFGINNLNAQIKFYNLDSVRKFNTPFKLANKVLKVNKDESIIGYVGIFDSLNNKLVQKGILFYKCNLLGNVVKTNYFEDTIISEKHNQTIYNKAITLKDTLVYYTTIKQTDTFYLKSTWIDDNVNIVKSSILSYPENDKRAIYVNSVDSMNNHYYLFCSTYDPYDIYTKYHHIIIKLAKNNYQVINIFQLDTNYYTNYKGEIRNEFFFKIVANDKSIISQQTINKTYTLDTNFNLITKKNSWRNGAGIICNTQNDTVYYLNNNYVEYQNTKPWNDTNYLWGFSVAIYKCNGTGINSSIIRRAAIAKMKHSTDSMQSITILPQLEEEDSVSENRQVPFYKQYDISNRNYIYMAYSAFNNTKARGYIGVSCLDSNLNIRWTRFIITPEWIIANSVHTLSDGVLIAADSNAGFGGNKMPFICKIDSTGFPVSVGSVNEGLKSYLVYPNPATDNIQVVSGNHYESEFCLYNLQGQLVLKENLKAMQSTKIKLPTLLNGIYFYKISSKKGIEEAGKLMVE